MPNTLYFTRLSGTLLAGLLLAAGLPGAAQAADTPAGSRPNVLLIVADDLGYSDIGAFGGEIDTPNLDALARRGQVFTDFYVAPACSPTRSQLMSGTDHHLVGLGTMAENLPLTPGAHGKPGYEGQLNQQALSLPEILRDNGYHTYLTGKWHLGLSPENRPGARGFESSFVLLDGAANHFSQDGAFIPPGQEKMPQARYAQNDEPVTLPEDFFSSDAYTEHMLSFLKAHEEKDSGQPFFAMVSYTAPHWPLQAPASFIEKYRGRYDNGYAPVHAARLEKMLAQHIIDTSDTRFDGSDFQTAWQALSADERRIEARRMEIYAAMVDNMDVNIGRLLQQLRDSGELDNTLVLFFSDNGADGTTGKGLFERTFNYYDNSLANMGKPTSYVMYGPRWAEISSTPLRGSKTMTSEGGISAPLIVSFPGHLDDGRVNDSVLNVMDILPTVLDLAGIPLPGNEYRGRTVHPPRGRSWLPLLSGQVERLDATAQPVGWELFSRRGIRQGDWKMIWIDAPHGNDGWQLYNLRQDRAETTDLYSKRPDIARTLEQAWQTYAEQTGVQLNPYPWPDFIR